MTAGRLDRKPNVLIEPLVDRWCAWSHLIAPATAAMNISKRHLRIMKSYVSMPQQHSQAVRNPAMAGGPFLDDEGDRTAEVRALLEVRWTPETGPLGMVNSVVRWRGLPELTLEPDAASAGSPDEVGETPS